MFRADRSHPPRLRRAITLALFVVAAVAGVLPAAIVATSAATPAAAADAPAPPFIGENPHWLTAVNYYRAMAGLAPVTEEPSFSAGAALHSCYMLVNGISHDEDPAKPGYSDAGRAAGLNGNVAVTDSSTKTDRNFVEIWMTGPFHALGILRPNLERVGYGRCDRADTPKWRSGATLDIGRGLGSRVTRTAPILFPGDGTTTNLDHFIAETPNPLTFCGWTGSAGLPVLATLPAPVAPGATATMTGPGGPLETCTLTEHNTTGSAQSLLHADQGVVVVPRAPLVPGRYTVTLTANGQPISWSFTVDPAAATSPASAPVTAPVPVAAPLADGMAMEAVTPVRIADSRTAFGTTTLAAGEAHRIQVGGVQGLPTGSRVVSANLTVTNGASAGFVTLWNCSADRPVVATTNFAAGETVANAAVVALDGSDAFCAYANTPVDVVIDVNGLFRPDAGGQFTPIAPQRLLDTRLPGTGGIVPQGGQRAVSVATAAGVSADATAAALTVTAADAAADGFVTVWPCDQGRPLAAGLNPAASSGKATSNLVLAPVAPDGTVCLYASTATHLIVDIVGFLAETPAATFTPSVPFRFIDTREVSQPGLSASSNGPLAGGTTMVVHVAGQRGVPADATAVSANIAVVGATAGGYLTAYPCGTRPATSNVNYAAGSVTSTAAQIPLSASGDLCIYTQNTGDVIVDIAGWWS